MTKKKQKKKSSLGIILSLLLFLGAAGTLFWFGWVQFDLPQNTYAVMFSKTSGYDSSVLIPGRFTWKWQRILPTNSKLIKFTVETQSVNLDFQGSLPSGDLYETLLPEKPDFSYHLSFLLSYRLKEEMLPQLLENGDIDNNNLKGFYSVAESKLINTLKKETDDFFMQNLSIDKSSYGELEKALLDEISRRFNYLEIRSFSIKYINYPDLELYNNAKDLFSQVLERRKATEIATEQWAIESKVNLDTKIDILKKYGELLTQYPILVDYFALDPESQVLDISNLKDYDNVNKE